MAELTARDAHEADFARKLGTLSARHRQELQAILDRRRDDAERFERGERFDFTIDSRELADFWRRVQRETEEQLFLVLYLLFLASADQHAPRSDATFGEAGRWAANRAEQVAAGYADHGAQLLAQGTAPASIFSPERIAGIAVTETTAAVSAGGEFAVAQAGGLSEEDYWYTKDDNRVCPICGPLHGRPRSTWTSVVPEGPPAHPNCRCWISYANQASPASAA